MLQRRVSGSVGIPVFGVRVRITDWERILQSKGLFLLLLTTLAIMVMWLGFAAQVRVKAGEVVVASVSGDVAHLRHEVFELGELYAGAMSTETVLREAGLRGYFLPGFYDWDFAPAWPSQ